MTVVDKTTPDQHDTLTFELDLKHAPEKVWRALTEPALLEKWLLPMTGDRLEVGAAFTLQTQPQPGWDGKVEGVYQEIEPMTKLQYSWVVGHLNTVVTFHLTPTDDGTQLTVLQSGFHTAKKENFAGARYGWRMFSNNLVELLPTID